MKKLSILLLCVFLCGEVLADEAQEHIYLIEIINSLNAIQPLIIKAEHAQPSNRREVFHYEKFTDKQGAIHNGLLEDIAEIKKGIQEKINQTTTEPRIITPLQGDYINGK